MREEAVRFMARVPKDLAEWLKQQAKSENRSMNGQLVEELQKSQKQKQRAVA